MTDDMRSAGTTPGMGSIPLAPQPTPASPSEQSAMDWGQPKRQQPQGATETLKQDGAALKDKAAARLSQEVDTRKQTVTDGLKQVSKAIGSTGDSMDQDQTPDWLRGGLRTAAASIEDFATRIERKDGQALMGDVKSFAQSNPAIFLAGCAALGFVAVRTFKAGSAELESAQ